MSNSITMTNTQMSQGSNGGMYFSQKKKKQKKMYGNCLFDYNGEIIIHEDSIHEVWRQIEKQPIMSILQDNIQDKVIDPLQRLAEKSLNSIKEQFNRKQDFSQNYDVEESEEAVDYINPFLHI